MEFLGLPWPSAGASLKLLNPDLCSSKHTGCIHQGTEQLMSLSLPLPSLQLPSLVPSMKDRGIHNLVQRPITEFNGWVVLLLGRTKDGGSW